MSARVWAVEKLTEMHPLPEGWAWEWWEREQAWVVCRRDGGWMYFDSDGRLHSDVFAGDPPRDAVLALCLASKGLDSMETMAQHMVDCAVGAQAMAEHESDAFREHLACAEVYRFVADMLLRGRVEPCNEG